ncbi:nucleotidyltransferase domain-containing protein [Pseudonocardia adelaidensis]|uniref:Amino acid transporter n=1 Tax=Pseudonocardia adelaidensis TaxID=648754 RepID=A0ABP9NIJ6_9PSEU
MRPEPSRWEPAPVEEVAAAFARHPGPWWVAGGVAIELAVGRRIRDHADVDIGVLRTDHVAAHDVLPGWELWAADPPGSLRPWVRGEVLSREVHDVWCRPDATTAWRIQLMIDESEGPDWVSRRDPRVRLPLGLAVRCTAAGVPYLAPQVQLYHKAGSHRPKDLIDFDAALPVLGPPERTWLRTAIERRDPGHAWLHRLRRS